MCGGRERLRDPFTSAVIESVFGAGNLAEPLSTLRRHWSFWHWRQYLRVFRTGVASEVRGRAVRPGAVELERNWSESKGRKNTPRRFMTSNGCRLQAWLYHPPWAFTSACNTGRRSVRMSAGPSNAAYMPRDLLSAYLGNVEINNPYLGIRRNSGC
jgi:hypothetical protein